MDSLPVLTVVFLGLGIFLLPGGTSDRRYKSGYKPGTYGRVINLLPPDLQDKIGYGCLVLSGILFLTYLFFN
tara:strand:- start:126 stop:341 length:216 start_codon:yes stop_codon:yes gene_type:complete